MLEDVADAFEIVLTFEHLAWLLAGTLIGLVIGVLPGMGGPTGMSILLPVLIGLDPNHGLALLIGMAAVTNTSDTFPSVLLGIPGSGGSQATIVDGYPLARQGKAAFALGASFVSSMLGGIIGAVMLLLSVYLVTPLVLGLRTPMLFMLTLLGVALVSSLSRPRPLAGLIMGVLGLVIGSIGIAPATAVYRFTFGSQYLSDGISVVVVALALFALPEAIDLLVENRSIAQRPKQVSLREQFDGARAAMKHKGLILGSSVCGNIIGIIPGLGASLGQWVVYGLARQFGRNTDGFGKGDIRGVIAPEAANNATEGGTLVPTLMFGIPGSPSTAILLGGLVLMGITPGPDLVTQRLPIILSIVWTLALANIVATGICFSLSSRIARISFIPSRLLVPVLVVFVLLAGYQASAHFGDVVVVLVFGVAAWGLKRLGWPRIPLLMGLVLSQATERYLFRSIARYEYEWLTWPRVIIAGILIASILVASTRMNVTERLT